MQVTLLHHLSLTSYHFDCFGGTHLFEGQNVIALESADTREDDGEFLITIQLQTGVSGKLPSDIYIRLRIASVSNVVETANSKG